MTTVETTVRIQGPEPESVTGVQLMQGVGVAPARGFWADAWSHVLKRKLAVLALLWVGLVAFFAVFSPILASGHPIVLTEVESGRTTYPLFRFFKPTDWFLLTMGLVAVPFIRFGGRRAGMASRARSWFAGLIAGIAILAVTGVVRSTTTSRDSHPFLRDLGRSDLGGLWVSLIVGVLVVGLAVAIPSLTSRFKRAFRLGVWCAIAVISCGIGWNRPVELFDYQAREAAGEVKAVYTLVPWSPGQRYSELSRAAPGTTLGEGQGLPEGTPSADREFLLGTDAFGTDVLSQLMHACRLSISIGVVSTGIALMIGVTMGALMGYFGGWVDLLLYRVVEIFMAVPVLFLLIVAVAVLPTEMRSTYVLMAIIGCFTWTGMARFTRAEFLKLRSQDFVQSAKAVGLPLHSIMFKHMLPNGVAPVLVDTSFAVAAAITVEAVLSYLGLGPIDQASWGKLLASAINSEGQFKWWLAVFPGAAIFFTVLSYNIIGEALRDAIDPRLKKARV